MYNASDWVIVGRFGRPHGIRGLISVHSFTDPRENILDYKPWHIVTNKQWTPLKLVQLKMSSQTILAQIQDYSDRESVAQLTNAEIAIKRDQLPKLMPNEFYWHELIGMEVINKKGAVLGSVAEVMPTGANDVLVVEGEKRYLIPYLPGDVVLDVNIGKALIQVDWDVDF